MQDWRPGLGTSVLQYIEHVDSACRMLGQPAGQHGQPESQTNTQNIYTLKTLENNVISTM